jgi:uncharacterized protein DUF3108
MMNPSANSARSRAGAAAALIAAAGLVLAACGGSSPSGTSGSSGTNSPSTGGSSTPPSSSSSGSGSSASTVSSSSVPFPIAVGNTWVYKSVAGITGESSTITDKVLSVTPVSGGSLVTMSNKDSITGTTTHGTYIFHSDGSITYPSSELGTSAVIIKGSLQWPPASVIDSGGTTHSSVEMAVNSGTKKEDVTAHISVKGDGTTSVRVPAGSYSTTVVQMTEAFTMLGYSSTVVVKTWLASGVGPVQSEATIDILGHTEIASHLELVSFTHG